MKFFFSIIGIISLLIITNCGKSKSCCVIKLPPITFTSERTSLEKQILGSYKEIRRDVWIISSAKTVTGLSSIQSTNTNISNKDLQLRKRVISAVQTIEYNKDDVLKYKKFHYIGENRNGFLEYISNHTIDNNPEKKQDILNMINEVNDARLVLMLEVINRNENLTINDLDKIKATFGEMNINNAKKGEMIESATGEWIIKQ